MGLIFPVQVPWVGEPSVRHGPLAPQGASVVVMSLLPVGHYTRGVGCDKTASLPFLPISMWAFLYILSCRTSVLLIFRLFSESCCVCGCRLVCPWGEVSSGVTLGTGELRCVPGERWAQVCPWGEGSSGSSCSAIFIQQAWRLSL